MDFDDPSRLLVYCALCDSAWNIEAARLPQVLVSSPDRRFSPFSILLAIISLLSVADGSPVAPLTAKKPSLILIDFLTLLLVF
jgi:hypothetical protein